MTIKYAGKNIDEIVHCYSDTLIRVAVNHTKNLSDAEDMVQDVYLRLMRYKGTFLDEQHLKAWLIRVTINRCKDHFKSSWFKKRVAMPEDLLLEAPLESGVFEEIFELETMDRTIVYLHYYEGYSIKEISEILKKKPNTIGSRLQRARKKLKHILEERSVV